MEVNVKEASQVPLTGPFHMHETGSKYFPTEVEYSTWEAVQSSGGGRKHLEETEEEMSSFHTGVIIR